MHPSTEHVFAILLFIFFINFRHIVVVVVSPLGCMRLILLITAIGINWKNSVQLSSCVGTVLYFLVSPDAGDPHRQLVRREPPPPPQEEEEEEEQDGGDDEAQEVASWATTKPRTHTPKP